MLRAALQAFLAGEMDKLMLEEWRGRCKLCDELTALKWDDVLRFYFGDQPPQPEKYV